MQVGVFPFQALGRARAYGDTDGFVKIVAGQPHGELLGMHVIGPGASDIISEGVLAIRLEATLDDLRETVTRTPPSPKPPPNRPGRRSTPRFTYPFHGTDAEPLGRATSATRDCRPGGNRAEVARAVRSGEAPASKSPPSWNRSPDQPATNWRPPGSLSTPDLATLEWDGLDAVLEAASQAALRAIAPQVLSRGVDLVALSAGATLDADFLASLLTAAQTSGARIWVPSGAIGALDVVRAARVGEVASITLTTTKRRWRCRRAVGDGAGDRSVGSQPAARDLLGWSGGAVRGFPQNVNVAALLALAADDPERLAWPPWWPILMRPAMCTR